MIKTLLIIAMFVILCIGLSIYFYKNGFEDGYDKGFGDLYDKIDKGGDK